MELSKTPPPPVGIFLSSQETWNFAPVGDYDQCLFVLIAASVIVFYIINQGPLKFLSLIGHIRAAFRGGGGRRGREGAFAPPLDFLEDTLP